MDADQISFIDNPVVQARREKYVDIHVSVDAVLKSWRESLFSFEWILPDGRIRAAGDLPAGEQEKRKTVETSLNAGAPLEKPVLGIGLMDNVEIGAGRATFLTLAALGAKEIPVHVLKSNSDEFRPFESSES